MGHFVFQMDWIYLEVAFVPSVIRPSSFQGPASWSGGPHGQIPQHRLVPVLSSCLWAPGSTDARRSCPHQSAESPPQYTPLPESKLVTAGNGSSWLKLPALLG